MTTTGSCLRAALGACLAAAAMAAAAQASAPAAPGAGVSERARREADRVFQWIRLHGERPRTRPADGKRPEPSRPGGAGEAAAGVGRRGDTGTAAGPPAASAAASRTAAQDAGTDPPPAAGSAASAPLTAVPAAAAPQAASMPAVESVPTLAGPALIGPVWLEPADPVASDLALSHQVLPEFSFIVMQALRKGLARLRFTVQLDGTVSGAEVLRSTDEEINAAVLAAVSQWRFQPVRQVRTAVVELGFSLD
jgi:TonB family protein